MAAAWKGIRTPGTGRQGREEGKGQRIGGHEEGIEGRKEGRKEGRRKGVDWNYWAKAEWSGRDFYDRGVAAGRKREARKCGVLPVATVSVANVCCRSVVSRCPPPAVHRRGVGRIYYSGTTHAV